MEHSQIATQFFPFSNEISTKRIAYYTADMYAYKLKSKNTYTRTCTEGEREGEGDHLNFILVRKSFAFVSRFSGNYSSRKTALLATATTMTAMMTNTDFLHAMPFLFNAPNS